MVGRIHAVEDRVGVGAQFDETLRVTDVRAGASDQRV
jgi:hypothetical protein